MKLDREELAKTSALTLDHYNERAEAFREGTRDHDVSQNIAALLQAIEGGPPFTILDFGCGPGRDLKVFSELGHVAIGLEGAGRLAAMARNDSGCEVWEQDFLELDLPESRFDGVYHDLELWRRHLLAAGFVEIAHYYRPEGLPFEQQPWLASLWRRPVMGGYFSDLLRAFWCRIALRRSSRAFLLREVSSGV